MLVTCAVILSNAKSCLQLPEYHRLVGCEKNLARFQEGLPSLVKVDARQMLNAESDSVEDRKEVEAGKAFFKKMEVISLGRRIDSWAVPVGLAPVQIFLKHIINFPRKYVQR